MLVIEALLPENPVFPYYEEARLQASGPAAAWSYAVA